MRAAAALLAALLLVPSLARADIDETFVREGSDGWGKRLAAGIGIPGFGRSIAVVIGVGAYTNGWKKLEAPERDVIRMRDFLRDQAGFDRIYTLTDGAVTRARIRHLMVEELPELVGPEDRLVFYFSGHGTQRALYGNRTVGYLVLGDSAPAGFASMIDMRDVERWWEGLAHAKQSLFILDACFSGLGLQGKGDDLRERTIAELSRRGHHLMTAGAADQESFASLSKWGGSLFTTALLDGMRGRADAANADARQDGIVSLKELWDYVEKRIRAEVPPETMTPQLASFEFSNAGEFFFIVDPDAAKTAGAAGPTEAKGEAETPAGAIDPREMQLWNDVKDSGSATLLRHFVARYPSSPFRVLAEERLAPLDDPAPPVAPERGPVLKPPEELFAEGASGAAVTLKPPGELFAGAGVPKPVLDSGDRPETLADQRHATGQAALARNDTATAIRYFKLALAADAGHVPSLRIMGELTLSGRGMVSADEAQARAYWQRCAEAGDAVCVRSLAALPEAGNSPDADSAQLRDRKQADELYIAMMRDSRVSPTGLAAHFGQRINALADAGNARAQVYVALGAMVTAGIANDVGTTQYALLAVQRASLSNDPLASLLGYMVSAQLSQGLAGIYGMAPTEMPKQEDVVGAARRAAEQGDAFAASLLAVVYSDTASVIPANAAEAQRFEQIARDGGFDPDWLR